MLTKVTSQEKTSSCALCGLDVQQEHAVIRDDLNFCCHGCSSVYQILQIKGEESAFKEHPLFLQAVTSGLISNPQLLEQCRVKEVDAPAEEMEKLYLEIEEMWCPSCAEVIGWILMQEKGVKSCVVDYSTDLAVIEFSKRHLSQEKILNLISKLGYLPKKIENVSTRAKHSLLNLRLFIALFCAMNIMMFTYPIYSGLWEGQSNEMLSFFPWLAGGFSVPLLLYSAYPIFRRFWTSLQVGYYGMETLVVIGVSAAFILSCSELLQGGVHVYFDSMAMIVVFVLLGKSIESKAKFSAKESLVRITRSLPQKGRKQLEDGSYIDVSLKHIKQGDTLLIRSGERVVLDDVIVEGNALLDESSMTGEAIPVHKEPGKQVIAGTCLKQGALHIKVTSTLEESTLKQIIDSVEQDLGRKTAEERLVDRVVHFFVPIVLVLATGAWFWTGDVLHFISVLLISCPCAIGIATPLAESLMIGAITKNGALIRNRRALKALGQESVYVFDKTGTVTKGQFKVMLGLGKLTLEQKRVVKGLVQRSCHPLSLAIDRALLQVKPMEGLSIEEHMGLGLKAGDYRLGSKKLLEGVECPESLLTCVYFAKGDQLISTIQLEDEVRTEVKALLEKLPPSELLSGDNRAVVERVAKTCGFSNWIAEATPLEKREYIEELKALGDTVAMVGDGINDAPALTCADVGISVISATDLSIQISDVLLTQEHLGSLPTIRKIARKGQKIIRQNLFWAFFYNCLGIGLACAGLLQPIFAAFAMIASSLMVLFNSLRVTKSH